MAIDSAEEHHDPEEADHEGLFDAQMSLPLPFMGAPEPFTTVLKRNGREEVFDRRKITNAIFRAAESIGGADRDLADSLARAVTIYMTKQLGSHAPTVDHIHDAVERVLIQMSHVRTAFAYARYRDRRARIRRLRDGDMRLLLGELKEARAAVNGGVGANRGLFVRTSADSILSWDRARIVEALVRETGLEAAMAEIIAVEVEQQLQAAAIETLTTSLVRELVAARLVAHGLQEYRERHQRLGVPLYDCERIIRGVTDSTTNRDPVATDYVLAGAVKKEYALARVYSPHVSEAHLQGAIHLHGLEKVDRLRQTTLSPAMVAAFGVGLPNAPDFASPPRNAVTFLAQLAKTTATFQAHFSGPLTWDAVNVYFAPFLHGYSDAEMSQFAQMMVYEFAYRAMAHGGDGPWTELRIAWNMPARLVSEPAIGPEGVVAEACYGDFEHTAQQLAWKLFEVLRRCDGLPVSVPVLGIPMDERFFKAPGAETFLAQATALVEAGFALRFPFHRGPATIPASHCWQPVDTVFDQVSLNLPRIGYTSGSEARFMNALDQIISVAALALQERFAFLEGLLSRNAAGPLGLLGVHHRGIPLLDLEHATGHIAVQGLNEAVQILLGVELHESAEAVELGQRILQRLQTRCQQESRKRGFLISVASGREPWVSRRFAELDATAFPNTAKTAIKIQEPAQSMTYTVGAEAARQNGLTAFERARLEGQLHPSLDGERWTRLELSSLDIAAESIADLLKKAYFQTGTGGISL